jgi:hypothetical protein
MFFRLADGCICTQWKLKIKWKENQSTDIGKGYGAQVLVSDAQQSLVKD